MHSGLSWSQFFQTDAGKTVLAWEQAALCRRVVTKLGSRAVQLGLPELDALDRCPIAHRILVCSDIAVLGNNDLRVQVLAQQTQLPLRDECADLIVWPHGLDRTEQGQQVLAEIYRVLAPNGVLVSTSFNSCGPWRLRQRIPGARPVLPPGAAQFGLRQTKEFICRSGLTLEGGAFGVYAARSREPGSGSEPGWIDSAGDRWWPTFCNVILLTARKRAAGMTLVGRKAFQNQVLRPASSPVVQKQFNHSRTQSNL